MLSAVLAVAESELHAEDGDGCSEPKGKEDEGGDRALVGDGVATAATAVCGGTDT